MNSATRELCLRCLRAQAVCFCGQIRPFEASARFVILSHPNERRKRIGTGRMAHLCIANSLLFEGVDFTGDDRVEALLQDATVFPMLLYPGESSIQANLPHALHAAIPCGRQPLIFVLDTTWSCARAMFRLNRKLAALPRLSFSCAHRSGYRFRRQPFAGAFSTIEAIHFIIDVMAGPGGAHANLLEVFNWMVEKQCSYNTPGTARALRGFRAG